MSKSAIQAFALPFHLEKSKSHETIVTRPLAPFLSFSFHAWDGIHLPSIKDPNAPFLFFQYPPPQKLIKLMNKKIIWIPMWDHIRMYPSSFWKGLPKTLKVVAFSNAVYQKTVSVGLQTLRLQYYCSPEEFKCVSWSGGRVLFYWNRIGMIGIEDLTTLCQKLRIKTLYFQNQLDPGLLKSLDYTLPQKLGDTIVISLPKYLPRNQYQQILAKTNIYLTPRIYEGIGLSFIEALARGCCVVGMDASTMNEYIDHNKNGYLFRNSQNEGFIRSIKHALRIRIPRVVGGIRHQIKLKENWDELEKIDPEKLGKCAYEESKIGFEKWQAQLKVYANFISDW